MFLRWVMLPLLLCGSLIASQADERSRRIESGRVLLQQRAWQAAAGEFKRVLQVDPKDAEAHIGLGIALWGSGDRESALASFRRATESNPSSPNAYFNVALALRDAGELTKAIAAARTALKLRPDYEEARLALGMMLQQRGDTAGAMAEYRLVIKRNPRSAEAYNWLGVAYMQRNRLEDAIAALRQATRLKPDYVRAHNNLGSTLAQAGDIDAGIQAFKAGLVHAPGDLQLNLNLGSALRTSGDAEGAIRHFRVALKQDPDNAEIHYQLGLALRDSGELEGAISELETALRLNPQSQEGYYVLGQALRQVASAKPRPSLRQPNSEAQSTLQRGILLARNGDLKGAVENLTRAVALEPESGAAHYHLGAALWYAGERSKAVSELEAALKLDPAAAEAYSLRSLALREAGDPQTALRDAQRAIALNPKLPAAYFDAGVLFLRLNRTSEAVAQFEAGLNVPGAAGVPPDLDLAIRELRAAIEGKQDHQAHIVLGRLMGLAGAEPRLVIAEFEAALRIKPDSAEGQNSLGLVYRQVNEDEKAIAAFREAIRLNPAYADAHANLGAILTATDVAAAVRELEKAVELQAGLLRAHYNLAIAYGLSPKHGTDREIQQLRKLLALDANHPRADFSLGKALLRKGAAGEAVVHLERAVRLEPEFGEAHYQLGLALNRAGRAQEAAISLQKGRDLVAAREREQIILLDIDEGKAALAKGDLESALSKFRRVLTARPDLADVHYQLGLVLVRKGNAVEAEASFHKALELAPAHRAAKEQLDRILAASVPAEVDSPQQVAALERKILDGNFAEAQPLLESYVKERPNSAWGWYALGYSLFAQRKIADSINALSKSLSLDVTNANAHKVLGRVLMLIGRFDAAQREFEIGEKYDPKSAELPFNLGRLYSIQDQWLPAREAFERAIRKDPSYMEAYDGLGFALEALGETDAAIANYLKAAQLNDERKGTFATPYINLSTIHHRSGDAAAALEFARKAIGVNPNADRAWFQLARAHERRGEPEAAVDAVKRAIALNGNVSSYHYVLGTLYRRLGKQVESREAMETFARLDRESGEIEQVRREGTRQAPHE